MQSLNYDIIELDQRYITDTIIKLYRWKEGDTIIDLNRWMDNVRFIIIINPDVITQVNICNLQQTGTEDNWAF